MKRRAEKVCILRRFSFKLKCCWETVVKTQCRWIYIYNQNVCSRGFFLQIIVIDLHFKSAYNTSTTIVFECVLQIYRDVKCAWMLHFFILRFHLFNVQYFIRTFSFNADCVRSRPTNSVFFLTTNNITAINEWPLFGAFTKRCLSGQLFNL